MKSVLRKTRRKRKRGISNADKCVGEFYLVGETDTCIDVYWHRRTVKHRYGYTIVPACFLLCEGYTLAESQYLIDKFLNGG